MENRIRLELRGRAADRLKELDLDGVKSGGEINFGEYEFNSLESLDISNSFLTSLKNFPVLPNLKRLELPNNRLSKGLEELAVCHNLKFLNLSNNRFKSSNMEVLQPLASLTNLTHLEIGAGFYPEEDPDEQDSPIKKEIRNKIFSMIPSLQYLDQEDIHGQQEESEDSEDVEDEEDDEEDESDDDLEDDLHRNGVTGDDEDDEDDDSDTDDEDGVNNVTNGNLNGSVPDFNNQFSDEAEDEDDEVDEEDHDHRPGRGKKRKYEDEGLP